jgi:UDP-glucuronate 4-epimerase
MAPIKFTRAILAGEAIDVYNLGDMRRDFTYIDDIVAGVLAVLDRPPVPVEGRAPHRVFNIGNSQSEPLMHFIDVLEAALGRKAVRRLLPMQPGDVQATAADVQALQQATGWKPTTGIEAGLAQMVRWYLDYFKPA